MERALDSPSRRPRELVVGAAAAAAEPSPCSVLLGPAAAAATPPFSPPAAALNLAKPRGGCTRVCLAENSERNVRTCDMQEVKGEDSVESDATLSRTARRRRFVCNS